VTVAIKDLLYIAGPMTGYPGFNAAAFDAMADTLRAAGYDVVSPVEMDGPEWRRVAAQSPDGDADKVEAELGLTWPDFLARDVQLLAGGKVTGVVVLPGWDKSRGARLETFVARMLQGLPIYRWDAGYGELRRVRMLELAKAWLSFSAISFYTPYNEEGGFQP
jgi:hypothetical protein